MWPTLAIFSCSITINDLTNASTRRVINFDMAIKSHLYWLEALAISYLHSSDDPLYCMVIFVSCRWGPGLTFLWVHNLTSLKPLKFKSLIFILCLWMLESCDIMPLTILSTAGVALRPQPSCLHLCRLLHSPSCGIVSGLWDMVNNWLMSSLQDVKKLLFS